MPVLVINKHSNQTGQALLEFALVLGVLLLLLTGILVVGYWMSAYQVVAYAARQGAREASLSLDNERIVATVKESMRSIDPEGNMTSIYITPESQYSSERVRGGFITVTVNYNLPFFFSNVENAVKDKGADSSVFRTVKSNSTSRIECKPEIGYTRCFTR